MVLSIKSTEYNDCKFIERVDAKYYFLQDCLIQYQKQGIMNNLNEFITNITDGDHAGQDFVDEGILFLKNSSIKDFDISLNDGFYITKEKHQQQQRSAIKPEDVLFTTIGHLGTSAIVPSDFVEANMNQNFVKMTVNKNKISPYYLSAFLNSRFVKRQLQCILTGNIQSILTYPKIKHIQIIRSEEKTEKIVENLYMSAIRLRKRANQKIETAINIFNNEIGKIFQNILVERCFEVKNDFLSNVNLLWTPKYFYPQYVLFEKRIKELYFTEELGKIANMHKGIEPGSDFYSDYLDKSATDVPFIRTSDVYNYQIDLSPDNFVDANLLHLLDNDIQKNDIIFTKDGKISETGIITKGDNAVLSSGIEIIRINKAGIEQGYTQEYIFVALASKYLGKIYADRYSVTSSTIPHLKENFIKKFYIPLIEKRKVNLITKLINNAVRNIEESKELITQIRKIVDVY